MTTRPPRSGGNGHPPDAHTATERPRTAQGQWFKPRREPGRLGVVSVVRLLALEVVLGAVFFVVLQQLWAMLLGGTLGLLAVVAMFGRSNGRWWSESLGLWLRYKMRAGRAGSQAADPRIAALCELAPELVVEDIEDSADGELGMGSDGAGWFAVLEIAMADDAPMPPVPLAALAAIADEAEQAGVVIQVVSHRTAARDNAMWVAVRLDATAVAQSVIDQPGSQVDVPVVLAELTHRVERLLHKHDLRARPLRADELTDALVRSCDLLPNQLTQVREDWDCWHSTRLAHGCYWLRTWPDPERNARLFATLMELPAALISISFLIEPSFHGTTLRCLVRLATARDHYQAMCANAERIVGWTGAQLTRLDGQHAPAVYASAPSGGGAR